MEQCFWLKYKMIFQKLWEFTVTNTVEPQTFKDSYYLHAQTFDAKLVFGGYL